MNKVSIFALLLIVLVGCTKTIYQTVPEVHHEYHHTKDSVFHTDSIIDRQTTIIREVDSVTMAQYGIQLKNMEKAWLIQNDKLYKEIERLRNSRQDTLFVHDSIPVPYPVEVVKEVERPLKMWERWFIKLGGFGLFCIFLLVGYIILKIKTGKFS